MKFISKFFLSLITLTIILIVAYVVWVIIDNQNDEPLASGLTEFFTETPSVPDAQNGFIAINGLNAPADQDIIVWGIKKLSANSEDKDKAINNGNEAKITFKGDYKSLECWVEQNDKTIPQGRESSCASAEQIHSMISGNKLLLDRIATLENYENFIQPRIKSIDEENSPDGQLFIYGQMLLFAKMVVDAREGKVEQALASWLVNAKTLQKIQSGRFSLIMQSVILVVRKAHAQTLLPIIAEMTPQQLGKYHAEIESVLDVPAFGGNGWDVVATMRNEFGIIMMLDDIQEREAIKRGLPSGSRAFYKPNATKNRFYAWAKRVVEISKVEPEKFADKYQEITSGYFKKDMWSIFITNPGNVTGELLVNGMIVGQDLIASAQIYATYNRMLMLYVLAKTQDISTADMPKFVENADLSYRNPLTGQPFGWDSARKSIYFAMPIKEVSRRQEIFY